MIEQEVEQFGVGFRQGGRGEGGGVGSVQLGGERQQGGVEGQGGGGGDQDDAGDLRNEINCIYCNTTGKADLLPRVAGLFNGDFIPRRQYGERGVSSDKCKRQRKQFQLLRYPGGKTIFGLCFK